MVNHKYRVGDILFITDDLTGQSYAPFMRFKAIITAININHGEIFIKYIPIEGIIPNKLLEYFCVGSAWDKTYVTITGHSNAAEILYART